MKNGVILGYFPIIREMAERNLPKALEKLLKERGVKLRRFERYAVFDEVSEKLRKLFEKKLRRFEEEYNEEDIEELKSFFEQHKKDLSVQHEKDPIPEKEDIIILLSTSKLELNRKIILSNDTHFTEYKDEIYTKTTVEIIALKKLNADNENLEMDRLGK